MRYAIFQAHAVHVIVPVDGYTGHHTLFDLRPGATDIFCLTRRQYYQYSLRQQLEQGSNVDFNDDVRPLLGNPLVIGKDMPVAFHAPFDEEILARAFAAQKVPFPGTAWLDLAALAPALFPKGRGGEGSLDHWLAYFGIEPLARHDALGDAFAEAQLLLVLLAEAARKGVATLEQLLALTHVKPRR